MELPHHDGGGRPVGRPTPDGAASPSPAPRGPLLPRDVERDWVGLTPEPLPLAAAASWAVQPDAGALVVFAGTVRDHAEGRPGVTLLEYEAYEEQAAARLRDVARGARERWPALRRLVLLHRVGALEPTEVSVLVAATSPHRPEAFAAARWCIDTVKSTVPIWKREHWEGGSGWATCAQEVADAPPLPPSPLAHPSLRAP